jgi:hypothetical protein
LLTDLERSQILDKRLAEEKAYKKRGQGGHDRAECDVFEYVE